MWTGSFPHKTWRGRLRMPQSAAATCWLFPVWHIPAKYLFKDKKQGEEAQGE